MIHFERHILENGLVVLLHEDRSTPMVAVNVTYKVGSRNEDPHRTGFAHLFEHLMFAGSKHAQSYDEPIQYAGGDSNAFTNHDTTSFYSLVPARNVDIALFLEADRMQYLNIDKKSLRVQQGVVAEEFAEVTQQPYGDVWHVLSPAVYREHPYSWPVLGKEVSHITNATIEDVRKFYKTYYGPNNAILCIAGNISPQHMLSTVQQYFGQIPERETKTLDAPRPEMAGRSIIHHVSEIPAEALFMAFPMGRRSDPDFYAADLLTDVLSEGKSSRLQRTIFKQQKLCSFIDAYITGTLDYGLVIIEARCNDTVHRDVLVEAIWKELDLLKHTQVSDQELHKFQNNVESSFSFSQIHVLQKASSLAFYEQLGDAALINHEKEAYLSITPEMLRQTAQQIFRQETCTVLFYDTDSTHSG